MTIGWLVYCFDEGEPRFLGLYQTKEKAEADRDVVAENLPAVWRVASVPFVGWGQAAPGVFSQNGPPPLKLVKDE